MGASLSPQMRRVGDPSGRETTAVDRAALYPVALALLFASAPLVGAVSGWRELATFSAGDTPTHISTAVALLLLACSKLALVFGRDKASVWLLIPSLFIGSLALLVRTAGVEPWAGAGESQWTDLAWALPRLPSAMEILLLGTALALAARNNPKHTPLSIWLASSALAIAIASIGSILLGEGMPLQALFLAGLPGALSAVLLAAALLMRRVSGWPGLLSAGGVEGQVARIALPLVVLTPVFAELLSGLAGRGGHLPEALADIFSIMVQVTILLAVLLWIIKRLTREHRARRALTRALDSAPIALTDLDGTVLHWSQGCERLYGWTPAEATGRSKRDLLGFAGADDPATGEASWQKEMVERRKDGSLLHILEQGRRLEPRHGGEPILVLSMTDIGDRVRAEQALRRSEARLALALEAHEIGTFDWELATETIRLGRGSAVPFGFAPGSVLSAEEWRNHVHPDDLPKIREKTEEARRRRDPKISYRYRRRGSDGSWRILEGTALCIYDGAGELERLVGVFMDVTERERKADALQAREAHLRTILETVPDAMIVLDPRGRITSFGVAAQALFGYSESEVLGRAVQMLIPGLGDGGLAEMNGRDAVEADERARSLGRGLVALHRGGAEIPIELAVGSAQAPGEPITTLFVRDVSERVAAEARSAELQDQLMHVSRLNAMGEMAAGLAHELNQPLTAIVNFLGAASVHSEPDLPPDSEARRLMAQASAQALRAGEIIRRMRSFATKGTTELRAESLTEAVEDTVTLAFATTSHHDVAVQLDLDPSADRVLADRVQLQQVLFNLMKNAIEALRHCRPDSRYLVIRSRGSGDVVEVRVEDNGPGIAPEMMKRLWEPFVSAKSEGMGVGLSICRRIVEAHGGTLSAANNDQGGATFSFTLRKAEVQGTGIEHTQHLHCR
jgi:two-component system, LuxR family, sensor kinase FixL